MRNGLLPYAYYRNYGAMPLPDENVRCYRDVSHVRLRLRCYDARMNDPDALPHNLCDLCRDASRGNRDAVAERGGKSSSSGGDDRRSSDASTSHAPNSCARTTKSASNPSTKDCSMRTKHRSKTSRR